MEYDSGSLLVNYWQSPYSGQWTSYIQVWPTGHYNAGDLLLVIWTVELYYYNPRYPCGSSSNYLYIGATVTDTQVLFDGLKYP